MQAILTDVIWPVSNYRNDWPTDKTSNSKVIYFLTVSSLLLGIDEQRGIERKRNHYEQPCSALELRSSVLISLFMLQSTPISVNF